MSEQARYFRVGAFVLGGLAALLACVLLLGAGSLLDRPIVVETVFDESVQGLQVGSAVKLRGVEIGRVSLIGFARDFYDLSQSSDAIAQSNLVLVRMDINIEGAAQTRAQQERNLQAEIDRGLRLQLTPLGITGTSLIQGDYLDPQRYPPLRIEWQPQYLYAPSAPSTITQLSGAADRLLVRIGKLDVERLLTNLDTLLVNANRLVGKADLESIQTSFSALLDDLRQTSSETRAAVRQAGIPALHSDSRSALAQLNATLTGLRRLVDTSQEDLATALANLRVASENLRDASETARSYPSLLLFGQPPNAAPPAPGPRP